MFTPRLVSLFALTLAACVPVSTNTSVVQGDGDAAPAANELSASDLSILVPLKSEVPADQTFGVDGTGLCNAPGLGEIESGSADGPILSPTLFNAFARDVWRSVRPLIRTYPTAVPGATGAVTTANLLTEANVAAIDTQEKSVNGLRALTSEGICQPVPGFGILDSKDIEALTLAGAPITLGTRDANNCVYSNWRVVAMRFDLCPNRPEVAAALATATTLPDGCGTPDIRVTAQPFLVRNPGADNETATSLDTAMHFFYKLESTDVPALLTQLRALKVLSDRAVAALPDAKKVAPWDNMGNKRLLMPHPGMRTEMDCRSAAGDHPVANQFKSILKAFAREKKLAKITFLSSDNTPERWSMGVRIVYNRQLKLDKKGDTGIRYENFNQDMLSGGKYPFSLLDTRMNSVDHFYRDTWIRNAKPAGESHDDTKTALQELFDMANPDKTNFNFGGKQGATCISCHMRDQTLTRVKTALSKSEADVVSEYEVTAQTLPPTWREFGAERVIKNLRNFGYGPDFQVSASHRVLNEAEALRVLINRLYPAPATAAATTTDTATATVTATATASETTTQTTDAPQQDIGLALAPLSGLALEGGDAASREAAGLEILKRRCTYCHGLKKAPDMNRTDEARDIASSALGRVRSDATAVNHMPPGKKIPQAEIDAIEAWTRDLDSAAQ